MEQWHCGSALLLGYWLTHPVFFPSLKRLGAGCSSVLGLGREAFHQKRKRDAHTLTHIVTYGVGVQLYKEGAHTEGERREIVCLCGYAYAYAYAYARSRVVQYRGYVWCGLPCQHCSSALLFSFINRATVGAREAKTREPRRLFLPALTDSLHSPPPALLGASASCLGSIYTRAHQSSKQIKAGVEEDEGRRSFGPSEGAERARGING